MSWCDRDRDEMIEDPGFFDAMLVAYRACYAAFLANGQNARRQVAAGRWQAPQANRKGRRK